MEAKDFLIRFHIGFPTMTHLHTWQYASRMQMGLDLGGAA